MTRPARAGRWGLPLAPAARRRRARQRPVIIGLTGSIGMGKSAVARMLARHHVPLFDADAAVHRAQGPGGALVGPILAAFPGTQRDDGGIDRGRLGARVLGDRAALKGLEAIVHPHVARDRARFLRRHRARRVVVLDIPLLFETGGAGGVNSVWVVCASVRQQRARVLARPGMTPARLARIRQAQWPDLAKLRAADAVIDTGTTRHVTRARVDALLARARMRGNPRARGLSSPAPATKVDC